MGIGYFTIDCEIIEMLLARPRIEPNECLVSYLIRISEKNGFKHIGHLLRHAGLAWKNNRVPVHQVLTGEFNLNVYLLQLGLATCSVSVR